MLFPYSTHADDYQNAIRSRYVQGGPIKILIVPGHDDTFSGAVYNNTREADLNLVVAEKLYGELARDPKLDVTVSRTSDGYIAPLTEVFKNTGAIIRFIRTHKNKTEAAIEAGLMGNFEQVAHGTATTTVAYQLYGTSMWAEQEKFDLIIHIHFNDYGSRKWSAPGEYGGFSIYVPEIGLPNAYRSKVLGTTIAERLGTILYSTNMPGELKKADRYGVIEDFELIALGANQTLSIPSILIEYGYIYEPMINSLLFDFTSTVLARSTASGVDRYVGNLLTRTNFSYIWKKDLTTSDRQNVDVLAVQFALKELGFYPPHGTDQTDCPISGIFGACTTQAVRAFQRAYGLSATGFVGAQTRAQLNSLFSK